MRNLDLREYKSARVLITGSNGFVGCALAKSLFALGFENLILTSSSSSKLDFGSFFQIDFSDISTLSALLSEVKPDYIINTAAISSIEGAFFQPEKALEVNAFAPELLARYCAIHKVKLVHFSTDFVFDGTHSSINESQNEKPISSYGSSKWLGDKLIQDCCTNYVIIRPIMVFGEKEEWQRHNFYTWLEQALQKNDSVNITADQWRQPTYIVDLLDAVLQLTFSPVTGLYHLAGADYLNVMDFARKIAMTFNQPDNKLKAIDTHVLGAPEPRPLTSGFDLNKVQKAIYYHPKSIDKAILHIKNGR
jgi:dTDP-4-dehydrorhamnose reductase